MHDDDGVMASSGEAMGRNQRYNPNTARSSTTKKHCCSCAYGTGCVSVSVAGALVKQSKAKASSRGQPNEHHQRDALARRRCPFALFFSESRSVIHFFLLFAFY
jgi:hypothetical protein